VCVCVSVSGITRANNWSNFDDILQENGGWHKEDILLGQRIKLLTSGLIRVM